MARHKQPELSASGNSSGTLTNHPTALAELTVPSDVEARGVLESESVGWGIDSTFTLKSAQNVLYLCLTDRLNLTVNERAHTKELKVYATL